MEKKLHYTNGCGKTRHLTPEIKTVAEKENMSTEELMELVAKGSCRYSGK